MLKIKYGIVGILYLFISQHGYPHEGETHEENNPDVKQTERLASDKQADNSKAIALINQEYQNVIPLFRKACFDCHSNETKFPWYSQLPIISTIIENDISEAKSHLLIGTSFPFEGHGSPLADLQAIEKSINQGSMPPLRYQIMHWDSFLSADEKSKILNWVSEGVEKLKNRELTNE